MMIDRSEEKLCYSVIGAFFEVHNFLGFGFLEHHYVKALDWELRERGHEVEREVGIAVRYKHLDLGHLRLDMVIDGRLVVEAKATAILPGYATRQVFNYLRASNLELGLLFHFGPKPIFHRIFCRNTHEVIPSMPTDSEHAYPGGIEPG
jgi:GxxExxY protein